MECTAQNSRGGTSESMPVSQEEVGLLVYGEGGAPGVTVTPFGISEIPAFVLEEVDQSPELQDPMSRLPEVYEPEEPEESQANIPRSGSAVTFASSGYTYTESKAVLDEDGRLWMWGQAMWGSNINHETHPEISQTPIQVMDHVAVVSITASRTDGSDVPNVATAVLQTDGSLLGLGLWRSAVWWRCPGDLRVRVRYGIRA